MGRETKNFRQSAKSQSGNQGAREYGKIQRQGNWGRLVYGTSKKRRNIT